MKVWPKNDQVRKLVAHPIAGKFRFPDGHEEWPDDTFTFRLIRDGDLLTEDPASKKSKEK